MPHIFIHPTSPPPPPYLPFAETARFLHQVSAHAIRWSPSFFFGAKVDFAMAGGKKIKGRGKVILEMFSAEPCGAEEGSGTSGR